MTNFKAIETPPVTVQTSQHLPIVLEVFRTLEKKNRDGTEQKLYEHACAHLAALLQYVICIEMPIADFGRAANEMFTDEMFIVGKTTSECGSIWEFQGVFDTKERAIAACLDARYFVGPAQLNVAIPLEKSVWPGAFHPLVISH